MLTKPDSMLCIRNAPASIISNVLPDQCNISAILLSIYIIELFTVVNTDRHTRLFCSNNLTLMSAAILNFELHIKLHLVTVILDHSMCQLMDHGGVASCMYERWIKRIPNDFPCRIA